jgi:hypothetical protein
VFGDFQGEAQARDAGTDDEEVRVHAFEYPPEEGGKKALFFVLRRC